MELCIVCGTKTNDGHSHTMTGAFLTKQAAKLAKAKEALEFIDLVEALSCTAREALDFIEDNK